MGYYFYKYKKSVNDFIDDKDIYRSIPSFLLIAIVINVFSISIMWLQLYLVNFNVPLVFSNDPLLVGSTYLVIQMIITTVTGPITEEFIFRGFLLNRLIKKTNIWLGIFISSALFAAFHLDYKILIGTFLFGIIASLLYLKTRNLLVPILIHMFHNSIVFIQTSLFPTWNKSLSIFVYMDYRTNIWIKSTVLLISTVLVIGFIVYLVKSIRNKNPIEEITL